MTGAGWLWEKSHAAQAAGGISRYDVPCSKSGWPAGGIFEDDEDRERLMQTLTLLSELGRSPTMRAGRVRLKSRRDDLIIAQGKRGTSAALGYGRKTTSSPFSWFAAPGRPARQTRKKGRLGTGWAPASIWFLIYEPAVV